MFMWSFGALVSAGSIRRTRLTPRFQEVSYGPLVWALSFLKRLWTMGPFLEGGLQWCYSALDRSLPTS